MAYTNINDPSAHFQTALYTGNSSNNHDIVNTGNSDLQPDLIWHQGRSIAVGGYINDSTRGANKYIYPFLTTAEGTVTYYITNYNTDGFEVGSGDNAFNKTSQNYVAWQWKANGGTTSTNSDGDINSTVQVNSDAGFSIVTYSPANNTARNIGHGLGVTPSVVITRAINRVEDWRVFHSGAGSTGSLTLNSTAVYNSNTVLHTGVTSTTFGVGTDFSVNGAYNYISYVFAEKQGYSKFGKYAGNGSTDGPFIYTGFKPAFILLKQSSNSGNGWFVFDSKRDPDNGSTEKYLRVDESGAEGTASKILDMYSIGYSNLKTFFSNDIKN